MSGKIEISRELAERVVGWYDGGYGGTIIDEVAELRAMLAAPVVERQPDAYMTVNPNGMKALFFPSKNIEPSPLDRPLYAEQPAQVAVASGSFSDTQIKALNQFIFEEMGHPSDWCFSDEELKKCLDKVKELNS